MHKSKKYKKVKWIDNKSNKIQIGEKVKIKMKEPSRKEVFKYFWGLKSPLQLYHE